MSTKPSSAIKVLENTIFYYSSVSCESCAELNLKLRELDNSLQRASVAMEFEPVINLRISSYGGEVFAALSTIDTIRSLKTKVHTFVEGNAASAGTLMSVIGNKRTIGKHSFMLIHQVSGGHYGNFEQLMDGMDNTKKLMEIIKTIYKKYTKIPMKELDQILKRDIWFDADLCLKYGLVDEII